MGASKFKVGHLTLITPILRVNCHLYALLVLDVAYRHAKVEHSHLSRHGDMIGAHQNING